MWLLPIVYEQVPFQITSSAKELSAFLTVVYFLPTVGDHMCLLKISGIGHKRMFFLCCVLTCESINKYIYYNYEHFSAGGVSAWRPVRLEAIPLGEDSVVPGLVWPPPL